MGWLATVPKGMELNRSVIIVLWKTYMIWPKKKVCFRAPDRPYQNKADPTFFYAILKNFLYFYIFLGQFEVYKNFEIFFPFRIFFVRF